MNRTLRDFLILIVVFGGIWAAVAVIPFDWGMDDIAIGKEQEQQLGDIMAEKLILSQWDDITDNYPKADSALKVIYTRLLNEVPEKNYDYKFYILRDTTINAFTIAGGHIFIFEGLLHACESPEELAAVLAHEIGHAEENHVTKKLVKDLGLEIVGTILSGGNDNILKEAGKVLLSKGFDRQYEREADRYAGELLEKAKISPFAIISFFTRLDKMGYSYDEDLELVMSHPHTDERIKNILAYQGTVGFEAEPFTMDWKAVQQSLKEEN